MCDKYTRRRFAILLPTGDATERPQRRSFMEYVNNDIFLSINAGAHPSRFLLLAALFLAYWLVPLAILLFVLLWIRKPDYKDRAALITATITMMLGLSINQIIGLVYFHPRPFMVGLGYQYLPHWPDNSFPSDHATVLWSLAFALLMLGALCAWAVLLGVAGAAVVWARVYDGVHFPFEMGGSLVVALVAMSFTFAIHRLARPWLMPSCIDLYENRISLCRLPPLLFPRQPTSILLRQRDLN
jgi:undecaprenyl-diphosphatase